MVLSPEAKKDEGMQLVDNINPYLLNAQNVFIESRKTSLCDVPEMVKGGIPIDGENLFLSDEEYKFIVEKEHQSKQYIKRFLGAKEYFA